MVATIKVPTLVESHPSRQGSWNLNPRFLERQNRLIKIIIHQLIITRVWGAFAKLRNRL